MNCSEYKLLVNAYVDGEFDERDALEAHHHLEGCEACRRLTRHEGMMRKHFKASYEPDVAPDDLRDRLMGRLGAVAVAEEAQREAEEAQVVPMPQRPQQARPTWVIGPLAAAAAAAALVFVFWDNPAEVPGRSASTADGANALRPIDPVTTSIKAPDVRALGFEPIVEESVNWHRRNIPIEVTGPSGERVSTWLKPKVDFPVRLPRFERTGREEVSLLGARLSNIRDRQAAYVVYEVDGSKISVMLFDGHRDNGSSQPAVRPAAHPHSARATPAIYTAKGYNVAVIEDNGITYSITSELPPEDMARLVDAAFPQ